jgi:hypothetical protein
MAGRTSVITINTTCMDESGGNVYAMAFRENVIGARILNGDWPISKMTELAPSIYASMLTSTTSTGDIPISYANIDDDSLTGDAIEEGFEYYIYLYLVDVHGNKTVHAYLQNPLRLSVETTVTFPLSAYHVEQGTDEYAQAREAPPLIETIHNQKTPGDAFFAFYNGVIKTNWRTALYANIEIVPHESVVGNVYNITTEKDYGVNVSDVDRLKMIAFVDANRAITMVHEGYVFQDNVDVIDYQISDFYANVETTSEPRLNMDFNKTYYVYTVVDDKGFGSKVVRFEEQVETGRPPILDGIQAAVVVEE